MADATSLNRAQLLFLVVAAFAGGAGLTAILLHEETQHARTAPTEYQCPMHPTVIQD